MDDVMVRRLASLNNGFYRENGESFSRTRRTAWAGWDRACARIPARDGRCSVLDVACGNMRFGRYLAERFSDVAFEITGIDSCPSLPEPVPNATYVEADVVELLLSGREIAPARKFNATVSFGFMHHIPTRRLRVRFLRSLIDTLAPGGIAAVSFWQFMDDARLAEKARETTRQGAAELDLSLEEGDYLVGWDARAGAYRYCHSFTPAEVDELAQSVGHAADLADRFSADGRTGALNGYAVFRRHFT